MKLYVLDISIVGFVEQAYPRTLQYFQRLDKDDLVATTIVTVGESGWLPVCRRAKTSKERVYAYERMHRSFEFYRNMSCLPFDDVAATIFDQLHAQKIHIGTNDLAIAAITLSVTGILVTRNSVDFQRVPNLVIEDWTK